MAFNGDVQPSGFARQDAFELFFQCGHFRQDLLSRGQQAPPGGGQFHGFRTAHKQFDPGLFLQVFDLVRQSRLGDVQLIRSTGQAALFMDGLDGA